MDKAHLSFWDALIVASALRLECQILLSEDLQAGRKFGGMTIVNPFDAAPPARREEVHPRT